MEMGPFLIEMYARTERPIKVVAAAHRVSASWLFKVARRRFGVPSAPGMVRDAATGILRLSDANIRLSLPRPLSRWLREGGRPSSAQGQPGCARLARWHGSQKPDSEDARRHPCCVPDPGRRSPRSALRRLRQHGLDRLAAWFGRNFAGSVAGRSRPPTMARWPLSMARPGLCAAPWPSALEPVDWGSKCGQASTRVRSRCVVMT